MIINDFFESDFNKRPKLNEVDPHRFDSDEDYYAAKNAPPKRRSAPSDYPYSQEEDDAYFREIFRKKREAAAKAAQDKDQGVDEGIGGDMAKLGGIAALGVGGALVGNYSDTQQPKVEIGGQIAFVEPAHSNVPDSAMTLTGKDGKTYRVWATKGTAQSSKRYHAVPVTQVKEQGVTEANKKKEDDVRDVSLQRAITKAKGAFPTASSGIEALTKDLLQSQDQDRQDFEKIRAVDQEQERMLAQIAQVDQNQTQEIDGLEKDNSTLKRRLQQMQAVNARLEKTLASMSGRKKEKTKQPDADTGTPTVSVGVPDTSAPIAKTKTKSKTKSKSNLQPATSSMKSTAAQLAAPKADPMAAMANRIQHGDSSILEPKQAALQFEPSNNVLEPIIPQAQRNPRFDAAKRDAEDARYSQMAKDIASDPGKFRAAMGAMEGASKQTKPERPEADYGDEYQSMVKRVAQKAKQGPRKTVWDPVKRVYKTVPVNS